MRCNRIRLSSDCHLRLCLHHKESYDIYPLLKMQPEKAVEEIRRLIEKSREIMQGLRIMVWKVFGI